jgi:hypothetical protein
MPAPAAGLLPSSETRIDRYNDFEFESLERFAVEKIRLPAEGNGRPTAAMSGAVNATSRSMANKGWASSSILACAETKLQPDAWCRTRGIMDRLLKSLSLPHYRYNEQG